MASIAMTCRPLPARSGAGVRHSGPRHGVVLLAALCLLVVVVGGAAVLWLAQAAPLPETTVPRPGSGAAGPVADERYRWRPVAIGGGGFIVGLSSDRAGKTFVARADVYGAYIWQPDQDRWAQLVTQAAMPARFHGPAGMDGGVSGIVVAPSDGRRLYMAVRGTVLRSSDRGRSWQEPASGPFPVRFSYISNDIKYDPQIAVAPADPDRVLVGTSIDGVLRSVDGGRSWTKARGLPPMRTERTREGKPAEPALVWYVPGKARDRAWALVQGAGMSASTDGGARFAPLAPGGPRTLKAGAFTAAGTFYGADLEGQTVWRFHAGRWTDLVAIGALAKAQYSAVAVNPRSQDVIVFGHNGRAAHSRDGETWSTLRGRAQVGPGDPPWLRVADHSFFATSQVQFDPVVPNRLWIAAGTGVFHADVPPDAERIRWISQTRGIEELVTNDVVQAPGHAPLFAAWDFGIHVRADLDRFSIGYGPRERVLIAAQQLALTPADPAFVATNASDTRPCCAEDGQAVLAGFSEDAGRTWQRFATLPHPPGTQADDPWRMAFGMIAVSSGDPDSIVWVPSSNRAPFFTRDRGRTWQRVVFPGERLPFTGTHPAKHLQRKVLVADPVRPGTFYLVHSGNPHNPQLAGVWRTQDGGAGWTKVFAGEVAPKSDMAAKLRAMPGRAGDLFFTSAVTGAHDSRLRRSTDGGATWAVVDGVDRVDDLAFGKPAAGTKVATIFLSGYVRGRYGIWRSTDDARSWTRIAGLPLGRLDRVVVLGADPNVFGRVYIGWMGSGWTYGEPAGCVAGEKRAFVDEECVATQPVTGSVSEHGA